jgi:CheY-like chemotaxis protein
MNGFVFLEHVKKDLAHPRATVPIIVFSAAANIEQLASADLVLKKPVDLTVFFDAVHRYSYGRAT